MSKKLLLLGNNNKTDVLIKMAKNRGIYTILTDNRPPERSPLKAVVDEAWDISVTDIDTLVNKATEAGVSGVTCGASEVCMSAAREICKRMGLPFYISDYAWDITNDKVKFKELCRQCNVPVAEEFRLDSNFLREDLDNIVYPVIVKPADSCSSLGLHLCNNEDELRDGFMDAYAKSATKKVLVERYYSGSETFFTYVFKDGEAILADSVELHGYKKEMVANVFGINPSPFAGQYEREIAPQVEELFKRLGCRDGVGSIQGIQADGKFVVLEMNYRLPGVFNPSQDKICDCVLNFVMSEDKPVSAESFVTKPIVGYMIWLKAGTIASIEGVKEVEKLPNVLHVRIDAGIGDTILENSGMRQFAGIVIFGGHKDEVRFGAKEVNDLLCIKGEEGNNLLYKFSLDDKGEVILGNG